MRKLDLKENITVIAGDWQARLAKQYIKCMEGSSYACGRVNRMSARHITI